MGRLVDGEWDIRDQTTDEHGRYVRANAKFRGLVSEASDFTPEAGRYHLYVSLACGWSHRALVFRKLKGLEAVISVSVAEPVMGVGGWFFGGGRDPVNQIGHIHELYNRVGTDYTGRASVPVLWDKKRQTIVTNESLDIIRSLDHGFGSLARADTTYFPDDLCDDIEAMIESNYEPVNNGVYRAGFAESQAAYDEAVRDVFQRLEELELLLGERRYLLGGRITAADWCLFPTLVRFDVAYHYHFKCNLKRLRDFDNLWGYTRELYQLPGIAETCNFEHIKRHYYLSHHMKNPSGLIPIGPTIDFDEPHGRG